MSTVIFAVVFILIAYYSYRRANQAKNAGKSGSVWLIASIVFGALAIVNVGALLLGP